MFISRGGKSCTGAFDGSKRSEVEREAELSRRMPYLSPPVRACRLLPLVVKANRKQAAALFIP
jgi:hypothetical protein